MTYNSRLAQELGKWADTQPGGEAIHDALFRAYFVEARDISQPAVLLEIAEQRRPAGRRAREVLEQAHLQGRRRRRLGAVAPVRRHRRPTFVAGRHGVVGAQPYEVLEELVRRVAQPPDAEE